MEDRSYAESLKAGLEDAVAFINGDTSRGRVNDSKRIRLCEGEPMVKRYFDELMSSLEDAAAFA